MYFVRFMIELLRICFGFNFGWSLVKLKFIVVNLFVVWKLLFVLKYYELIN